MEGYQRGGGGWRMGEKVHGISSINGRWTIDRGEVRNSIGNVEAKELIYMTHGHELSQRNVGGGGTGWRGIKWGRMGQL